jgi:hypothetical protein
MNWSTSQPADRRTSSRAHWIGAIVAAIVLIASCSSTDRVEAGRGESSAPFGVGQIAVGENGGWLIDLTSAGGGPSQFRTLTLAATGALDSAPDGPSMLPNEALGVRNRLVVAGATCTKDAVSSDCDGQGVVAVLHEGAWRTFRFPAQPGDLQQNLVTIMGVADDGESVWLKVGFPEEGPNDGRIRAVRFDPVGLKALEWVPPSPGLGALCLVGERIVDYSIEPVLPPPVEAGAVPGVDDMVPKSVQVYEFVDGTWVPAANGTWSGLRPRSETLHCTPDGLSTSTPGMKWSTLGWTSDRGWTERTAQSEIAQAGTVPVGNLVTGQPVASIDGSAWIETEPGVWVKLPVAAQKDSVPVLAIGNGLLGSCTDSSAAGQLTCGIRQWKDGE